MSPAKLSSAFLGRSGSRTNSPLLLFRHHRLDGLLFFFSSSTAAAGDGEKSSRRPHFVVEYLINSCGLSSTEASKASKSLAHLKSTEKPDAFLGFMRSRGFNDTSLRKIVSCYPRWLAYDAERFSLQRTIQPRLEFWARLLGSKDHLSKLLKNYSRFLSTSIEKTVMPNLSRLRECGISDQKTALVLRKSPILILRSPQNFGDLMERVERMGVPRSSGMFLWALWAINLISEAKLDAKLRLMKSFGWSEVEFFAAFCKSPLFVTNSEEMLSARMAFLVKEVGYEPSQVALRPKLLMHSLERRLKPRHRVMQMLEASGVPCGTKQFSTVMSPSEKLFMEKYVIPHKEKVPGLLEMYLAACGKGSTT
ncbi:uncharacterized protein LOC103721199 [Phoenix dactylifera]|uniref:Uncharacterized protein LOC103721199 n=1 Tax=Phoenix dactylifera TaxID=42345 RepID=A0A8B7CYW6_PHODC|nr:uncharacterized protein LOC103721199 [Phoenix dactylifera]